MLLDIMYEVPSIKGKKKLVITKEIVNNSTAIDIQKLLTDTKSITA